MAAYGNQENAFAGLLYGLDNEIDTFIAQEDIEYGLPGFGYQGEESKLYNYYLDTAKVVWDADFVTSNSIVVTVNGVAIDPVVFDTDHDTTIAAVVNAVNALAGVECVLDTTDTDSRTILVRTKGATATVTEAVTLGGSQADGTITTGSGQVFVGIVTATQKEGALQYDDGEEVNVLRDGKAFCTSSTAAEANSIAYLSATGDFANSGTDIGTRFRTNLSAAGLAVVQVDGQKDLTYAGRF